MAIEKAVRTISEKTTSIQDPVELTQKGIITFVPQATTGLIIAIPTTIQNPVLVDLMPLTSTTAVLVNGKSNGSAFGWYCDLKLYKASDVSSAFGSCGSQALASEVGNRIRMSGAVDEFHVYVCAASQSSNHGASKHSRLASTAYWRKDTRFGSNAQKFLKVIIPTAASVYLHAKKQVLAYKVTGYNYD